MGGRSSLPTPGERSDSDSSGPPSLLWSPWMELGAVNIQVLVLRLNTSLELVSQISQLTSYIRPSYCSLSLKNTFLTIFPFSQWIPWSAIHLNDSSPGKMSEQPQLSTLGTFKRLPRSFWVSCHPALIPLSWGIMTPNVGKLPPAT